MSGQKVNLNKSYMCFSKGVNGHFAAELSRITSILITNNLGRYLGTLLFMHGCVTTSHFQYLLDRVHTLA